MNILNDPMWRAGSCDTGPRADEQPPTGMEKVPDEIIAKWKAYSEKLHKKWPHMKPARLRRKVAEYFKIKLT